MIPFQIPDGDESHPSDGLEGTAKGVVWAVGGWSEEVGAGDGYGQTDAEKTLLDLTKICRQTLSTTVCI